MGVKWVTYEDADPYGDIGRILDREEPMSQSVDEKLEKGFGAAFLAAILEWVGEDGGITVDMVFDEDAIKEYATETYNPGDLWSIGDLIDFILNNATYGELEVLHQTVQDRRDR